MRFIWGVISNTASNTLSGCGQHIDTCGCTNPEKRKRGGVG